MELDFKDRNIIVLGGSDGIGLAVATLLAKNHANVCIVGRNEDKLKLAINKIQNGNKSFYVSCDLTKPDSIKQIKQMVDLNWTGHVDSIVLNAGGPPLINDSFNVKEQDWHNYFQSLFLSQINLVSTFIDNMKSNNFGKIVSISSSSIIEPIPGLVISSCIRSALASWLKTVSSEVARFGINITTAVIGKISTNRLQSLDEKKALNNSVSIEKIIENNQKSIPIGRYGTPEEAANVIVFLLSKYSSYINGSSIFIDGGSIKKCF